MKKLCWQVLDDNADDEQEFLLTAGVIFANLKMRKKKEKSW